MKEIWSPVTLDLPESLALDWDGTIRVANNYDFTPLDACEVRWRLLRDPGPGSDALGEIDSGSSRLPAIEAHGSGTFRIVPTKGPSTGDILHVTVTGPKGGELWTWSATFGVAASEVGRVVLNAPSDRRVAPASAPGITPTLIAYRREKKVLVPVEVAPSALKTQWHSLGNGAWRLDYSYELDGAFDLAGVRLLGPGTAFESKRWLGRGPYRVWQNRMEGGVLDVHELAYNDSTPGESWAYPEFNGFFRDWRWLDVRTGAGRFIVENSSGVPYLGLGRVRDGVYGLLDLPDVGLAVLDVIPPIGTKFTTAEVMGPQSQTRTIHGVHSGTIVVRTER